MYNDTPINVQRYQTAYLVPYGSQIIGEILRSLLTTNKMRSQNLNYHLPEPTRYP
ncbi:hypothetical protein [Limnospira platensis]|uniref:hypothetical protein n=1 Tax=Limnospira platensis TaxID=118562 RepID=UPI0001D0E6CE|nr:hypothetical protein [Arthrospira platensis FACHB-439]MBD2712405.1 hypothetical protein [Arthrospira platensis FACHB-835]MDF2208077.1 hypothetical protein [Arthrospira platensis NCB002]QQW28028.1 hypothetical protein AP9108_23355 [Arthrospira sp. PCC 9108]BAI92644.1 hypothetical protein NIES39_L04870 [Arthrospira platensis NIES-39]